MRVLVTGSSGFIGQHLSKALEARGHDVWGIDIRPSSPGAHMPQRHYVADIRCNEAGGAWQAAFSTAAPMATIIRDIHPDAVAHLAAGVGPEHVTGNVHDTVTTNAQGTANVIDALRQYAPKATLLFTSSSEVYGLCPDKLFDEVTSPLVLGPSSEPRWCYAASKLAAEHLVLAHGGIVARIFNTTGPGQSEAYVLPRFVGQALRGEALTVYGDGSQVRCFCHVQDTVDALVRLLEGYTNPAQEQHDRIYNIGSDFPLSVGKLASVVRMLVNPIVAIVQQSPAPAGGLAMPYRKPALSRICWGYGWHPTKSLEQIILDTKAWKDT